MRPSTTLDLFPVETTRKPPALDAPVDREAYATECRQHWFDAPLRNALANFRHFEEWRPKLLDAMRRYRTDPMMKQKDGTFLNSYGSLNGFLWQLQVQIQPDQSRLDPLLDFCDHHQKVFLRRGLVIYCAALLHILEAADSVDNSPPATRKMDGWTGWLDARHRYISPHEHTDTTPKP